MLGLGASALSNVDGSNAEAGEQSNQPVPIATTLQKDADAGTVTKRRQNVTCVNNYCTSICRRGPTTQASCDSGCLQLSIRRELQLSQITGWKKQMDRLNTYNGLANRVVIITGAGQGLGRNHARRFAEQGAIAVIAELSEANGKRVEEEIVAAGGRALAIATDVTDERSVDIMVKRVVDAYGRIDCLINNAAMLQQLTLGYFWELSLEHWRRVIDVNVTGAYICAKAVVPTMQKANWGRIVNLSSPTVSQGTIRYLHYVTSKSAAIGMSRAMARELGQWNITVNTLWPGVVLTDVDRPSVTPQIFEEYTKRQSIPRPGTMDDHTRAVLFLCSDDAGFISGQNIQSDGGRTFL